jgi:Family of unknown function (DUF695)
VKEILIPDFWLAVRATYADEETVIRFRSERPTSKAQAKYSTMVILKWHYKGKKDGMPRNADLLAMHGFEESLDAVVDVPRVGIHVPRSAVLSCHSRQRPLSSSVRWR